MSSDVGLKPEWGQNVTSSVVRNRSKVLQSLWTATNLTVNSGESTVE